jgi:hypothetical protein
MNFFTNSCTALVGGVELFNARILNASKALFLSLAAFFWASTFAFAQEEDRIADVAICHQVGGDQFITIYVDASAIDFHLEHGDYLGACDDGNEYEEPCELSLHVLCPSDVSVECGSENNFELTGMPEASGVFCDEELHMNYEDVVISSGNCGKVISRTWIITLGSITEVCTHIITSVDTQGPAIIGLESEINVQCLEGVPGFQDVSVADACSGAGSIQNWSSQTGTVQSECVATTAFGPGADWAVWLPTLSSASGANFVFNADGGHFDQFADGSAHLHGTVVNTVNASEEFIVDLWFENKADWSAWSGQGRNYKNDLLLACATDNHPDWTYYELVGGFSTLTGAGALAGTELYIYHTPASYYFGFQLGVGANNKNCENGLSGWFTYQGFMGGQAINGHGDVNVDLTCEDINLGECIHNTAYTYFYRGVDGCGHASIATQQINVNDTTAPVFSNCPQSFTMQCSDPASPVAEGIEAIDNCAGDVSIVYLGEVVAGNACSTTLTRTWSATDICGNRSDCVQVITIVDTNAPSLSNLPESEITVECDAVPAAAIVSIADNCDQNPTLVYNEEIIDGNCPGNYTIVRSWYGYDQCQNSTETFVQTIHVQDTTAPVFDTYNMYDHIECNLIPAVISASDNCGNATVEVIFEVVQSGGCLGTYHRIYRATDECGNTSETEQFIAIQDNTAPVLVGLPENNTLECSEVSLNNNGGVTGSDNCGQEVFVTYTEQYTGQDDDCPETYDIIRTWVATDYCGNESTDTRTTHVQDTTAPEFVNFPADITISCDAEIPAVQYPTAIDNCDTNVDMEMAQAEMPGTCPQNYFIHRTFRGYDNCGNERVETQTITVIDDQAPVFGEQQNSFTYECNTEIPVITPAANDNCGEVSLSFIDSNNEGTSCYYTISRVWTAVDECGNASDFTQYIHIQDTTAPAISGDNQIDRPCDDYAGIYVQVADNCNEYNVTFTDEMVSGSCAGNVIRHYTATDICGNVSAEFVQIIHLGDAVAPVIVSQTPDLTVECGGEAPVSSCALPSSLQNGLTAWYPFCGNANDESGNGYNGTVRGAQLTTDRFGNQNSAYSFGTNQDIIVPGTQNQNIYPFSVSLWYNVDNITGTYDEANIFSKYSPALWNGYAIITANMGPEEGVDFYPTVKAWYLKSFGDRLIGRYGSAPFEHGNLNMDQWYHMVFTVSNEGGKIYINGNLIAEDTWNGTPGASSNSLLWKIGGLYDRWFNGKVDDVAVYNRTLTATEAQQLYTLQSGVSQESIEQNSNSASYSINAPIFADNCDNELTIDSTFTSETDGCTTTETYTWTATDHCGNSTTATTVVTIVDTTNPYFTSLPENVTVNCDATIPGFGVYAAADNCDSDVTIVVEESIIAGNCPQSYSIERTYRATDNCGNQAVETRYVYVIDEQAPYFNEQGSSFTYECGEEIAVVEPIAYDNCGDVSFSYSDSELVGNSCQGVITRTWTATDECGNSSTFNQYINIVDTQAPVVNPYTIEVEMPCDAVSNEIMISAEDCNEVVITYNDEYVSGTCAGRIIRTYSVSDICGNVTSGLIQQIINLIDVTAPSVEVAPADVQIECGEQVPSYSPIWSDNCASNEDLTLSNSQEITEDPCTTVIYQSWTAVDPCGNSTTVSRTITIVDSTAPVFTYAPSNEERDCNADDAVATAYADDNCSDVTIYHNDVIVPGLCPASYTIERTYTATDVCGNSASYTQVINVSDNNGPAWGENQTSFVYECGSNAGVVSPIAFDDCSEFTMSYADGESMELGCTSAFERTWIAVDACGNASSPFVQYISFEDTTEPVLNGCPSDLVLACEDVVPTAAQVTAIDGCDSDVDVYYNEVILGDAPAEGSIADCNLITPARAAGNPCGYPYDWAMAMFSMPTAHRWYQVVDGSLVQYPGGSMHLVAQLENVLTPGTGWNVDVWFNGGMDWAAWSTQGFPTSFKADCGGVDANFASWTYFLLQAGEGAELNGYGNYAGSVVNLVHAPSNNYFGYQLGDGANNYNAADNAFGGWFSYNGSFRANANQNFTNVSGAGDFAFELDCCPDYEIVRQWTAVDCSGNTSTCTQHISFSSTAASTGGNDGQSTIDTEAVSNERTSTIAVAPNPANNNTMFTFKAAYAAKTSLEVFDMTGKKVADVFMGSVEAGASYNVNFNVSDLATGVYTYRLTNGSDVKIDRLIINK